MPIHLDATAPLPRELCTTSKNSLETSTMWHQKEDSQKENLPKRRRECMFSCPGIEG